MPPAPPPNDPLSGHPGHLSIPQQHALDTFRKELTDEGYFVPERHDDPTLLRFLRARKFDLPKAKEMIIAHEKWRKENGVDELAKHFEFPAEHDGEKVDENKIREIYPQYYHKTDKDGRPVYIEVLGGIKPDNIGILIKLKDVLLRKLIHEYEVFLNEKLPATSKVVGHRVETSCTILDLKNVSLGDFFRVKNMVMDAAKIGQDQYPETMGKFYIINAPVIFSATWALIRPFLDEVTQRKITIVQESMFGWGSEPAYVKELLKQIPAENLPTQFGGKCKCEGGCAFSNAGPWNEVASAST